MNHYFTNPVRETALIHGFELNSYYKRNIGSVMQHCHEFYELYFFLFGEAVFMMEDAEIPLAQNTFIIVPPNTQHHMQFISDNAEYGRMVLWIRRDLFDPVLLDREFKGGLSQNYFILSSGNAGRVKMVFGMLEQELERLNENITLFADTRHYIRLLTELLLIEVSRSREMGSDADNAFVRKVKHYIGQKSISELTVAQIAEDFHYSPYHMMKKFKKISGVTLYSYLTRLKLLHAKQLIAAGQSAMQAAAQSGFGEYTTFYKAFVREFSISPRSYMHSFDK